MYLECRGGAAGRQEAETAGGEAVVRPRVHPAGNRSGQAGGGGRPQEAGKRHPATGLPGRGSRAAAAGSLAGAGAARRPRRGRRGGRGAAATARRAG